MNAPFTAACIQMTSGDDVSQNIAQLEPLLNEAVAKGAALIATPENSFYMRREGTATAPLLPTEEHAGIMFARAWAATHKVWLIIGSIRASTRGSEKAANQQVVIAPDGRIAAHYNKLHLFDVTLQGGHSYRESAQSIAGDEAVLCPSELGTLGLSICYDVRFPNLYRSMALAGAEIFTVPSAFTRPTGAAHWHVLLRARAIENAAFVLAPAQCGTHPGGRETYGHSLILNPWGEVLAEAVNDAPQVITATIDMVELKRVREQLPVLQHHRDFHIKK